MIDPAGDSGAGTDDEELLADAFDTMLQAILEGRTPDLDDICPDRPDLRPRITKAWSLACSVAGRREPSRPVLGGYEIVRELGHGGMGTVYLARHQVLQREVAIKVLPQSLAMSPRAKQRFLDEARALARVRHENIVHIHRVLDHTEMLAFEMELIDGPSLQRVVQTLRQQPKPNAIDALATALALPVTALGARTTVEWTVRLGIRIARALAEVHRFGLVHRDVKPSNILLRADGRPVLADFGLARDDEADGPGDSFAGTAVYAAPERLRDGDRGLDGRADIYSLGVTLCECLTQKAPYPGHTTEQVLRQIEAGRFAGLRREAPHVSRDLETVVARAMEPDPRHRYATADEFADDLERVLNFEPVRAQPASAMRRAGKFLRRHRRSLLAAVAGALLVLAALWPVADHFARLADRRAAGERALHAARTTVLSPENLHATWARSVAGATRNLRRESAGGAAQLAALATARDRYDEAIAAGVTEGTAALERAVVAVTLAALQPRATAPDPEQVRALLDTLPPLTRDVAAARIAAAQHGEDLPGTAGATVPDRFAAGLLCFLLGDVRTTARCWQDLGSPIADDPLLDACSALLLANDGYPERAYPRLFHAAKAFPGSTALALALTDAALVLGDLQLAQRWLQAVPERDDQPFAQYRRELLQAELLAASGDADAAAAALRRLARLEENDPLPVLRLAELAVQRGDWSTAVRQLNQLLHRWPAHSAARLELARVALLRRDVGAYATQVRHVLSLDLRDHSPGALGRFAEILRLGGLDELRVQRFGQDQHAGAGVRSAPIPLTTWLPPQAAHAVAAALPLVAIYDAHLARCREADARDLPTRLRAAWLTCLQVPQLHALLPRGLRVLTLTGPPLLGDWAAERFAVLMTPFARTLGDPVQIVAARPLASVQRPDQAFHFGWQLAVARDLDGDTLGELVVACPTVGASRTAARIELRSLEDGALLRTVRAEDDSLMFARAIAVLGDVDGDFCDELLIGAPRQRLDSSPEVQLRSGRTLERLWTATDTASAFGAAVTALGDVDGDGHADVLVGASPDSLQRNDCGRAILLSGRTGHVLREFAAEHGGNWFGSAVASAGDVDGDGRDDVIVGGNYGNAPGLVQVMSTADGRVLHTFADDDRRADFGAAIVNLGDVNGDGRQDWAIAAPGRSSRGQQPGRVLVLDGATGEIIHQLLGDSGGDGWGGALCALPDWRGDGRPALAIGAIRGGPSGSGYVRVYDLQANRPMQTFAGHPHTNAFGFSLVDLGHRDGDPYRDLGITEYDRTGAARIRSMSHAMLLTTRPGR